MSLPVAQFHDGRSFTSKHFSIRDEFRRVTQGEKQGIALAWSQCEGTPAYSIILVKSEGVIAQALSQENVTAACANLEWQLQNAYRRERFSKRIVAVLNFAPNWSEANTISKTGADALFVPYDVTITLIDSWLGRPRAQPREGDFSGMQERALITPRYHVQKRGPP